MDAVSLALSTGLGPVISVVIILMFAGLVYKIAGVTPAFLTASVVSIVMMFMDFIPVYWGMAIVFAGIAGFVLGGGKDGD
ncbi:hypothetical protein [Metallosphaera sedula]|uniref:hypothetical protein n=1 Tax=Metallosphaera sedula TaxID=43687 RepID=UPI0021FEB3A7|nr:hypothetical protein [Metallosphaera sedula]BBL45998.1 type 4 prepilin peptidase [Metallosphaera sedula]BBL46088.1 type 4 prepilin peptidase [Metallosphaera sedula]